MLSKLSALQEAWCVKLAESGQTLEFKAGSESAGAALSALAVQWEGRIFAWQKITTLCARKLFSSPYPPSN